MAVEPARVPMLVTKIVKGTFGFVSLESRSCSLPLHLFYPSHPITTLLSVLLHPSGSPPPLGFFIDGAGLLSFSLLACCIPHYSWYLQYKASGHTSILRTCFSGKGTLAPVLLLSHLPFLSLLKKLFCRGCMRLNPFTYSMWIYWCINVMFWCFKVKVTVLKKRCSGELTGRAL